jgi:predicted nucleic acid-binding protein
MKIVADTSAFLAVAMNEPERTGIILNTVGHEVLAPEVLPFEIGNAISAMVRRGVLDARSVGATWEAARAIPVELRKIDIAAALAIACRFQIYAYDAYFLECALSSRAPLLTLDKRLNATACDLNIQVLELSA